MTKLLEHVCNLLKVDVSHLSSTVYKKNVVIPVLNLLYGPFS